MRRLAEADLDAYLLGEKADGARGFFVALYLDPVAATKLAIPGYEPANELHITLAYVPEWDPAQAGDALANVAEVALHAMPLAGTMRDVGRFPASEASDGQDVLHAIPVVPGLEQLQQDVEAALARAGMKPWSRFGRFVPHTTLAYVPPDAPGPPASHVNDTPIFLDGMTVRAGDAAPVELPLGLMPVRKFNPYHEPGGTPEGGRFASAPEGGGGKETEAGVTSFTGAEPRSQVARDRQHFVHDLRTAGVDVVESRIGVGGWQDLQSGAVGAEHTWILRYRGNGRAERAIAAAAQAYHQQAAITATRVPDGTPDGVPRFRWTFGRALKPAETEAIVGLAKQAGFSGWTVDQAAGTVTVLTVPKFQKPADTARAALRFQQLLAAAGHRASWRAQTVRVTVMEAPDYERILNAKVAADRGADAGGAGAAGRDPGRRRSAGGGDGSDHHPTDAEIDAVLLGLKADFDPEKHPRGKTTPGSNAGSFAPREQAPAREGGEPGSERAAIHLPSGARIEGDVLVRYPDGRVKIRPDPRYQGDTRTYTGIGEPVRPKPVAPPEDAVPELPPGTGDRWELAAVKEFGTTDNPESAGYILSGGEMLDFSGAREGGTPGVRAYDHRQVGQAADDIPGGTEGMIAFQRETGAIRMQYDGDMLSVDFSMRPTGRQMQTIDAVGAKRILYDVSDPATGRVLASGEVDPAETDDMRRQIARIYAEFEMWSADKSPDRPSWEDRYKRTAGRQVPIRKFNDAEIDAHLLGEVSDKVDPITSPDAAPGAVLPTQGQLGRKRPRFTLRRAADFLDELLFPRVERVQKIIRHEGDKWVLYTRDGSRVLGRHPTREAALAQERAIEAHKHAADFAQKAGVALLPRPQLGQAGKPGGLRVGAHAGVNIPASHQMNPQRMTGRPGSTVWVEEDHPRGKTSEASTGGSFAPKGSEGSDSGSATSESHGGRQRGFGFAHAEDAALPGGDVERPTLGPDGEIEEPAQKGSLGSGHYGHEGRKGRGSRPRHQHSPIIMFRRFLARLGIARRRREAKADTLDAYLLGLEPDWRKASASVVSRARGGASAEQLTSLAQRRWAATFDPETLWPLIDGALQGVGGEDRQRLASMARQWVGAYAEPLIDRRLGDQLANALDALPADAPGADVAAAVGEVLDRAPGALGTVLQPMLHKLAVVSDLMQARAQKRERVQKDLGDDVPDERYVIETADDDKVCDVCRTVSDISKEGQGLRVREALAQAEALLDLQDEGELIDTIEKVPFPSYEDVAGISRRELVSLGYGLPPLHPDCRCAPILTG